MNLRSALRRLVVATGLCAVLIPAGSAFAGAAGQNPSNCGTGYTWGSRDFNVNGTIMREDLRHSYGCGTVGWGRLSRVGGTSQSLALVQSAWNPGGPSVDGAPGGNWTYTVDATPGHQVCAGFQAYWVDGLGKWHYIGWFYAGCYWG